MTFTVELENNNTQICQDILIMKESNKLETANYRTPTLNTNIMPKSTKALLHYKRSALNSHISKTGKIRSIKKLSLNEMSKIRKIVKKWVIRMSETWIWGNVSSLAALTDNAPGTGVPKGLGKWKARNSSASCLAGRP